MSKVDEMIVNLVKEARANAEKKASKKVATMGEEQKNSPTNEGYNAQKIIDSVNKAQGLDEKLKAYMKQSGWSTFGSEQK